MRRVQGSFVALEMKAEETIMAKLGNESRISASAPRFDTESIVDLLLSLPENATADSDAVDRAVAGRLQMELADRMRSLIGYEGERQAA
jgi:hypothetical protein